MRLGRGVISQGATKEQIKAACLHLEHAYGGLWISTKDLAALFHVHDVTIKKMVPKKTKGVSADRVTRVAADKQGRPREWSILVVCDLLRKWRIDADLFNKLSACPVDWWHNYPSLARSASGFKGVKHIEVTVRYGDGSQTGPVNLLPRNLPGTLLPSLLSEVRRLAPEKATTRNNSAAPAS